MDKKTRIGAYGVCQKNNALLLVPKKSGPYKGQLDLPGGGLEFGETPEETLQREFIEETASGFSQSRLLFNMSQVTTFNGYQFYHIGLIYTILGWHALPNYQAEDIFYWVEFLQLPTISLTPFAQQAVKFLKL
ncbi:hypothetical protein PHSC3_000394 [Chlamydiales bacterium STE3]|nr:hypothetical protein PHSC3_000394 [Chlamydiales bacterium STE3]